MLEITGEQSYDSLLIILDTAQPAVKSVIGNSKRSLKAFALCHSHYFKCSQPKKTICNNKFNYSWPSSVENSAVEYLQQRLIKHSALEVDRVKDHYIQADGEVKQFLSSGGGNQTAKLCAMIVNHTSTFVICGNEVRLASMRVTPDRDTGKKPGGKAQPRGRQRRGEQEKEQDEQKTQRYFLKVFTFKSLNKHLLLLLSSVQHQLL